MVVPIEKIVIGINVQIIMEVIPIEEDIYMVMEIIYLNHSIVDFFTTEDDMVFMDVVIIMIYTTVIN